MYAKHDSRPTCSAMYLSKALVPQPVATGTAAIDGIGLHDLRLIVLMLQLVLGRD